MVDGDPLLGPSFNLVCVSVLLLPQISYLIMGPIVQIQMIHRVFVFHLHVAPSLFMESWVFNQNKRIKLARCVHTKATRPCHVWKRSNKATLLCRMRYPYHEDKADYGASINFYWGISMTSAPSLSLIELLTCMNEAKANNDND